MSKSETPVDKVAGDADPSLFPEGVTMRRKGLVGNGSKGGTCRGAFRKGLRDRGMGASAEDSCADEIGREWKGIGGGGLN